MRPSASGDNAGYQRGYAMLLVFVHVFAMGSYWYVEEIPTSPTCAWWPPAARILPVIRPMFPAHQSSSATDGVLVMTPVTGSHTRGCVVTVSSSHTSTFPVRSTLP